ncbi:hypothetical protein SAMN02983003_1078 [Devosia enhydra]|uniref:Uncharacterized protein n=1 Tax=Devosia enhydra TaxID=665118 RepID=A0A1K2HV11_9HYPH|nr:hypothetical protein [Devosia enhydra]SFZ82440.1 hypothetical protein SAMN02983003_1078 [Devosia enhydra]
MSDQLDEMMYELKRSVDRQAELQQETNDLLRGLIQALNSNSQEMADARAERELDRRLASDDGSDIRL